MSEWGNPAAFKRRHAEGSAGEPPELKHLSRARKRENSASSGERKRSSPNHALRRMGLQDCRKLRERKPKALGSAAIEGESPVGVSEREGQYPE